MLMRRNWLVISISDFGQLFKRYADHSSSPQLMAKCQFQCVKHDNSNILWRQTKTRQDWGLGREHFCCWRLLNACVVWGEHENAIWFYRKKLHFPSMKCMNKQNGNVQTQIIKFQNCLSGCSLVYAVCSHIAFTVSISSCYYGYTLELNFKIVPEHTFPTRTLKVYISCLWLNSRLFFSLAILDGYCFAIPSGSISNENTFSYHDIKFHIAAARAGMFRYSSSIICGGNFRFISVETFMWIFECFWCSCGRHFHFLPAWFMMSFPSFVLATLTIRIEAILFGTRVALEDEWMDLDKADERWRESESSMVIWLQSLWATCDLHL